MSIGGFDLSAGVLSLGLFTGLTYGLLAAGLVLVYRSSRFINFAHGAIGVFGAAVCSLGVRDFELPYWLAFLLGIAVSAGVGALTEVGIVKPLSAAPRVLPMVASLGVATFLIFTALAINPNGLSGLVFPEPAGMPTGNIGSLLVTPAFSAQAILSPVVLVVLGLFLWRSRTGLGIRAAASSPDAASTAGVPARSMSLLAWAIAGGVAAFSVTLIIPTRGVVTPETLGPELLVRALAAAAIARFTNYAVAVGVAAIIGVVEQVMATNPDAKGLIELVILAAVVIALLTSSTGLRAPLENWGQRSLPRRLPERYRHITPIRLITPMLALAAAFAAACVPFAANGSQALDATLVICLAIVGISVVMVTGLGGQLSLAQFAYAAIGAAVSIRVSAELGYVAGVAVGAVIAAVVSVLLALPAIRVRGLQLGVASLIFAVVTTAWLLDRDILLGGADPAVRPSFTIFGIDTATSRGYYWIALAALLLVMAIAGKLRRGAWGRTVVAVRDNEDAARAMSLPARSIRLQTAAIGGLLAGIGGAVYGHALSNVSSANFTVQASIDAVTVAVIGGLGSIVGPLIGSLYLVGIPALLTPTAEATSALAGAWLVLIVYQQGGVAAIASWVNERIQDSIARGRGIDPVAARTPAAPATTEQRRPPARPAPAPEGVAVLDVRGVSRSYGGIVAVDDVSFSVQAGETVGLIGPNGAGKTTLFEVVSGFVAPDRGTVALRGQDITRRSPEQRCRLGIARSFQSATLYPTLSLTETVMVAEERTMPSSLGESLGPARREHERELRAREALERFGLTRFADTQVGALPTGTRRLAELVCAVQLRPTLVLLDEPFAGIAHAEAPRVVETLLRVRDELGVTLVIIEHDLPLLGDLCDRMVAMSAGRLIADGTPDEVRAHPEVVDSYVG
jgi:ABC-type branched-subunit amino acid transport system ATPase component/ABC-type branched-subunit amino acid transport system permease subunit